MKRSLLICLLFLPTLVSVKAGPGEIRIALAPHVGLPASLPLYSEDNINFYGTNAYLLGSRMLRKRAEAEVGHAMPSMLRFAATRIPNTSIIAVSASGVDDSAAAPFLSALINQFIQFKRDQKKRFYQEAIARVQAILTSAPQGVGPQIEKYRDQLVVASLLDTESDFRKLEEE